MATKARFKCPACGFAVFNRRLSTCESCSAELPVEFRFTAAQIAHIETDHSRNEKTRAELAREREVAHTRRIGQGDGGNADILGALLDGLSDD